MSERRMCHLIGADRSAIRYCSRRRDDARLRDRLCELAGERRRFGSRRRRARLRQVGLAEVNRKKTERVYREETLTVHGRRGREKATGSRAPIRVEAMPSAHCSVNVVRDQIVTGRRLHMPRTWRTT